VKRDLGLRAGVLALSLAFLCREAVAQVASPDSFAVDEVDEPVQIRSCPHPEYPRGLGDDLTVVRVRLQYVVDTLGTAEPTTIHVLGPRVRAAFVEPAIDAITRCRFKPAKWRGHLVRQFVQQAVVFYPVGGLGPPAALGEMPW
jgi:hypothetical protein